MSNCDFFLGLKYMPTDVKTPYLDLHQRVIYKSARGAYYVKDAAGKKYYGVKARYVAVVNGTARKLTTKNDAPPNKIAPKRVAAPKVRTSTRPVRSNAGKKRGPYKPRAAKKMDPSTAKAMSIVGRSKLAMRLRKVTFTFKPAVGHYKDTMRDEALKWYKMMSSDIDASGEVKILSMTPYESNKIAVTFRFTPVWAAHRAFKSMPRQINLAMESIMDPDDDGNYPLIVKGEPKLVMGMSPHLVSIA